MKKNGASVLKIFTIIVCSFFILYLLYAGLIYLDTYLAAKNIPQYTFKEYVRLVIYGSSDLENDNNTVSANFSIIDSNGNEIAWFERSWKGSYLSVEFKSVLLNDKFYIFPSKIYGKDRILDNSVRGKKFTDLEKYYNENRSCILLGNGVPENDKKDLYKLAKFAMHKYPVYDFGKTQTLTIDLSSCENGKYYTIGLNSKGGIEVLEL